MGNRATVYSANAVTLNFATQLIESGRGPDEFLKIEQQSDDFSHSSGLDGEGVWNELLDKYSIITVTLMQTAAGNGVLWAIHQASKLLGGSPAPLYIEDRKGTSKTADTSSLILKTPDETYAKEAGTTVWIIGANSPTRVVGGH
jgi:hypothetical protein